eukprot:6032873-Pyramimonas_sp.AAC.1
MRREVGSSRSSRPTAVAARLRNRPAQLGAPRRGRAAVGLAQDWSLDQRLGERMARVAAEPRVDP